MTTLKLMEMTLRKLDRPTDSDTVALYRERLLGFFNEALLDLAADFRPWRRDTVNVENGQVELDQLPCICRKVLAVHVHGKRRLFYYGSTRGTLLFPGMGNGTAQITYRYEPDRLTELTDEPQLPEGLQELLAEYAAARERGRFDGVSQNGGKLDLTLYRELKGKLKRGYPAPDPSRFYHVF